MPDGVAHVMPDGITHLGPDGVAGRAIGRSQVIQYKAIPKRDANPVVSLYYR